MRSRPPGFAGIPAPGLPPVTEEPLDPAVPAPAVPADPSDPPNQESVPAQPAAPSRASVQTPAIIIRRIVPFPFQAGALPLPSRSNRERLRSSRGCGDQGLPDCWAVMRACRSRISAGHVLLMKAMTAAISRSLSVPLKAGMSLS